MANLAVQRLVAALPAEVVFYHDLLGKRPFPYPTP